MNPSIRNGIVGGLLSYGLLLALLLINRNENIPIGALALIILIILMYFSAKNHNANNAFRDHVREPFMTFLIASTLYHILRLIHPGDITLSHQYFLAFLVSLIIGFLLALMITFVVRK